MPVVWLVVTVAFALASQPPRPAAVLAPSGSSGLSHDLCAVTPGTADSAGGLPGGIEVSRPLTPVYDPAGWPSVAAVPESNPVCRLTGPAAASRAEPSLGSSWLRAEYLLWWPQAPPIPPLVTVSRSGPPPTLAQDPAAVWIGGHDWASAEVSGGRFALGLALTDTHNYGLELGYLFLGSRTLRAAASALTDSHDLRGLGLVYVDARTGREGVFPIATPGTARGAVTVSTTTRVQGVEANVIAGLYNGPAWSLNGLVGYRFFQVHEGLAVEQVRIAPATINRVYDQFDGHNRFHGAQVGLQAGLSRGGLFLEVTGKVALGRTFEVVRIQGATSLIGPHVPRPWVLPGGVYALASNMGRFTTAAAAVAPEGTCRVGFRFGETGRLYVGYNVLYLSDAVRPGDQIDRVLNPLNVPTLNSSGQTLPPERPRPLLTRGDFWTQGLIFGFEARY